MTDDEIRIAVAECMGFKGCTRSDCDWRKCQHLHKNGIVYFPESYSTRMYPNFPADLNACHEMEKTLTDFELDDYADTLCNAVAEGDPDPNICGLITLTARQRCEAFLKVKGLWKP